MIRAILSGGFKDIGFNRDRILRFDGSRSLPVRVQQILLTPSTTWAKLSEYEATADTLAKRFADNFLQFAKHVPASVAESGIRPRV